MLDLRVQAHPGTQIIPQTERLQLHCNKRGKEEGGRREAGKAEGREGSH